MNVAPFHFKRLAEQDDVQSFHCGLNSWETDVSGFLKDDALNQQAQGLNVTWLCYSDTHKLKGFVSLMASMIYLGRNDEWRVNHDLMQIEFDHFPCVLIGQFGVSRDAQNQGIGGFMLDWVSGLVTELYIGVRFLTVHVERGNIRGFAFWQKHEFEIFKRSSGDSPIYMAYDLYSTTR